MSKSNGYWIGSTDDIFRGIDDTIELSDCLDEYDTCIKTVSSNQFELIKENSYATPTATCPVELKAGSVYLVQCNWLNSSNALVDRSLYVLRCKESGVSSTIMLSTNTDDLMVMKTDDGWVFTNQHTNTAATKCMVRVI